MDEHALDAGQLGLGDMDPEAFRRHGHRVVDWIADYLATGERYPVLSHARPGELRAALPSAPPEEPEPVEAMLADFERLVIPGVTHWNQPGFFAYFAITGSGPGILGEMLAAALNVNAMLWRTSPAATELEDVALDWLRQLLGLPTDFEGVINDTASSSSLYALAAAREAVPGLDARVRGLAGGPRLRAYTSRETHSSVEKAGIVLGIGQEGVRAIETDDHFRLDPRALERAIREDVAAGWRPFVVTATVGTTSTTSVDPVPRIADICERHGLWLHVDGAYGGIAAIVPELRHVLDGCERADSIVVNPHKWLFTPIDCSVLYCRRPEVLRRAFSLIPEYLRVGDSGVRNLNDYGTALGRRFRALKLWLVLRYFGRRGLVERIREHVRLAGLLAEWIDAAPDFERLAPVPFSTVVFRYAPPELRDDPVGTRAGAPLLDALNERLLETLNAGGEVFLSHTKVRGAYALRAAIGNLRTEERHVARLWELLREHARKTAAATV
jgi:aromatic-L-amino-acid/L-tryptophan decarboxylase